MILVDFHPAHLKFWRSDIATFLARISLRHSSRPNFGKWKLKVTSPWKFFLLGGTVNFLKKWGSRVGRSPSGPMLQTCHRHDLCDVCIMTPGAFYPAFPYVFVDTVQLVVFWGDRKKQDDWFEREMWIAKNGCLGSKVVAGSHFVASEAKPLAWR